MLTVDFSNSAGGTRTFVRSYKLAIENSHGIKHAKTSTISVLTRPASYNTRSNKVRVVKTPGGNLRYLHIKKKGSPVKCGDCGIKLPGVSSLCVDMEECWIWEGNGSGELKESEEAVIGLEWREDAGIRDSSPDWNQGRTDWRTSV
jgi:hypothetical protein